MKTACFEPQTLGLILTLSFISFLATIPLSSQAQLYSNGVNSITGNRVGISQNAPQASLHIKETQGSQMIGGGFQFEPLLRFEGNPSSPLAGQQFFWDLRMDETANLTFWSKQTSAASLSQRMVLGNNFVKFHEKTEFKGEAALDESMMPDGSNGHYLAMGTRELTPGNWMDPGISIFGTENGELQVMTNGTGSVLAGQQALSQSVRFILSDDKAIFTVDQELAIPATATGTGSAIDLVFTDQASPNADKRQFVLRGLGTSHPTAPNTLEFWDPNNNGNAWFSMPVRIGTAFNDIDIISADYRLYVQDGIRTERVKVDLQVNWADYVFHDDYFLMPLLELERFIEVNNHLPGIPTVKTVEEEGIELGEMNVMLLEKVEELTLHVISLQKQIEELRNTNNNE